ncbi:hypothetical protein FRX31_005124 [Thalictrum thalictroides]|uniref:Uncharacterized protein n=1 Tax=Thalictrum thalictroides TaxID=46969 RepID=A0A7J6X6J2_THATH|nr:hypothetical protein FRX31_005124 [Thalictrum thalictroides]
MASDPIIEQPVSHHANAKIYIEGTTTENLSGLAEKDIPATQTHEDFNHKVRVSKTPAIPNANVEMEEQTIVHEIVIRDEAHAIYGCHKESTLAGSSHHQDSQSVLTWW